MRFGDTLFALNDGHTKNSPKWCGTSQNHAALPGCQCPAPTLLSWAKSQQNHSRSTSRALFPQSAEKTPSTAASQDHPLLLATAYQQGEEM